MSEAGIGERAAASSSPGVKAERCRGQAPAKEGEFMLALPATCGTQLTEGEADESLLEEQRGEEEKRTRWGQK